MAETAERHLRWVLARMNTLDKEQDFVINGNRCFVEIERNIYLPASPENVAKAKQARFLEDLKNGKIKEVDKADLRAKEECPHIVWFDRSGYIYHERICNDCGACIELI